MGRIVLAGMLSVAVAGSAAAQNIELTGYWRGTYDCAQGLTGVNLTIRQGMGAAVEAVFHFYAVPQNPGVPTGCFRMQGHLDPGTREFSLTSDDGQWIVRPYGYIVVNFLGRLGADGRSMQGFVEGPGCTQFDLQRLDRPPRAPAACSDALNLSAVAPGGNAAMR
jgi:hypothetical protein